MNHDVRLQAAKAETSGLCSCKVHDKRNNHWKAPAEIRQEIPVLAPVFVATVQRRQSRTYLNKYESINATSNGTEDLSGSICLHGNPVSTCVCPLRCQNDRLGNNPETAVESDITYVLRRPTCSMWQWHTGVICLRVEYLNDCETMGIGNADSNENHIGTKQCTDVAYEGDWRQVPSPSWGGYNLARNEGEL